ncbi:MAG TPA: O-antigen ligase family protein [Nannocystaceae bacterium]|nr:O-antigen ligase family protein [Nannocystaceae bacterium]
MRRGQRDAWWRIFVAEPLVAPALLLFFSARSSAIFGGPGHADMPWHQAFIGWYDAVLLLALVASATLRCFALDRDTVRVIAGFGLCVIVSFALGGPVPDIRAALDGVVHVMRFAIGFGIGVWIVRVRDERQVDALIWSIFVLLLASAVFVYGQQFSSNQRLYFSGMTMASSSQIAAVVCVMALVRGSRFRLAAAALFLLLTFSRTSIVVTGLLCTLYVLVGRGRQANNRRVGFVVLAMTAAVALWFIARSPVFADVLLDRFDEQSLESLGLRLDIWEFARHDLLSGEIPVFGVGFGCTPGLLDDVELRTAEGWTQATHFHSILIEYAFGLGVLAIFPALWIVRRTIVGLANRSTGALLFLLFLACQSVDFSFYRPKEVLFWSLVLGIADAQTRRRRTHGGFV